MSCVSINLLHMRTPIVITILMLILAFEFAAKCNNGKTASAPAAAPAAPAASGAAAAPAAAPAAAASEPAKK